MNCYLCQGPMYGTGHVVQALRVRVSPDGHRDVESYEVVICDRCKARGAADILSPVQP